MSSGANALGVGQTSAHAELSLIEALRQGDEDAFGRLVDEYHASLRRVARLYVSNRAVADEVVQDTWEGVIQGLSAFEGRSSFKTWIFRILINHAKTRAVREGRTVPFAGVGADNVGGAEAAVSPERFHPADHPTEPGHWTNPPRDIRTSPEGRLLAREAGEQLQKAIDALPPNQRLVLTLRDVEGCSTEEVCNALAFGRLMDECSSTGPGRGCGRRSSHIWKESEPLMAPSTGMPCQELVELVTAYLDGALSPADRERCEAHWRTCPGCRTYLAQMQLVVGSLGQLGRRDAGENGAERDRLLDLFRTRGFHHRAPRDRSVPLGVADEFASPGDHISYFWESEGEFDAAAGFLAAGVERDEACVLLGHAGANSRVRAGLERRGLDPDELERRDRLHTVSGQQPADAMLREIGDRVRIAVDRRVPMVRVLGNLGWEHPGWPAEGDILRLEARVTDTVRNLPSIVMCAYDVRGLSGRSLLLGGVECHPLTLRRGALRRNEHHVPAEQFLETLALDAA